MEDLFENFTDEDFIHNDRFMEGYNDYIEGTYKKIDEEEDPDYYETYNQGWEAAEMAHSNKGE